MTARFGDPRLPERFWAKVSPEPTSGCWLWTGALKGLGYGNMRFERVYHSTHKFAYERLVGEVPPGRDLDHRCRTRVCCNPEHLEPVSRRTNLRRSPLVGRAVHGGHRKDTARTRCPRGHLYAGDNVATSKTARGTDFQRCRACERERGLEARR